MHSNVVTNVIRPTEESVLPLVAIPLATQIHTHVDMRMSYFPLLGEFVMAEFLLTSFGLGGETIGRLARCQNYRSLAKCTLLTTITQHTLFKLRPRNKFIIFDSVLSDAA